MAKDKKNGTLSKIIAGVAIGVVLLILGILIQWGPAIQDNTHAASVNTNEIERVDLKVDNAIMKQEKFMEDTTEKLHDIDKGVLRIEERLKARDP